MTNPDAQSSDETEQRLDSATYCESCGQVVECSDRLDAVEEPAHRLDFIEALGGMEGAIETTAEEVGECEDCGGQLVERYYITGDTDIPEPEYEPDPEEITGRDPDEDALLLDEDGVLGPEGWREASEVFGGEDTDV